MKTTKLKTFLVATSALSMLLASLGALALTSEDKQVLMEIRNNIFGGSRLAAAFDQSTISGIEPTVFPLEVENRGLLVWKIEDAYKEIFAREIGLLPPFTLSKISPLTVRGSQTAAGKFRSFLQARGLERLIERLYPEHYYVVADIGITQRAEAGAKLEFKTFVQLPGDTTPRLYRFSSHKAVPGVELLQLASNVPAALDVSAEPGLWRGNLYTDQGSLSWSVPLRIKSREKSSRYNRLRDRRFSEAFLDAGETVFGPMGVSANYYYDGSSVSGSFLPVLSRKVQVENTFSWSQYLSADVEAWVLDTLTEYLVRPNTSPVQVTSGGPGVCGATAPDSSQLFSNLVGCALAGLPPEQVFGLLFQSAATIPPQEFATLYYGLLDLYQGLGIFQGSERPKLFFSLLENPKTIFINFEIPRSKVKAFEQAFLPDRFRLAKIRFYPEQRKAQYVVSLNVYQSAGQNLSGFRAEWSTYVINPDEEDPKPRFSVLEAQTNIGGFDAVGALERYTPGLDLTSPEGLQQLIEPPSDVFEFVANEVDGIQLEVRDYEEQIEVDVSIEYPSPSRILRTAPTTDWMEANDFVYWGEVADILKYDNNVMFAELLVFKGQSSDYIRDTTFAGYVNPRPLPIILWNGPQNIALEPWGNLDGIQTED
jgi:hypothetical protein